MDPIGLYAQLACLWEVTACKPGNVHRYCDFEDASYLDYLHSAAAIGPVLARASELGIGRTVHEAIRLTRTVVRTNTNLGIVLLLAPLAAIPGDRPLRAGVGTVIEQSGIEDTRFIYQAIRLANPSGMGRVAQEDVQDVPTQPLRQVMALAAERDLVARQYANDFHEVFEEGVPALQQGLSLGLGLEEAIIFCHLTLLAQHPDSLIVRKRGLAVAEEASHGAGEVLAHGWPLQAEGNAFLGEFDRWLRRRTRGATRERPRTW